MLRPKLRSKPIHRCRMVVLAPASVLFALSGGEVFAMSGAGAAEPQGVATAQGWATVHDLH